MWFNRMLKGRQEFLVLGELLFFLAAWGICLIAAVDDYRVRTNAKANNTMAANQTGSNSSGSNSSGAGPIGVDLFGSSRSAPTSR
jgi:hypothetical protein